jgi:hypothetical protein
VVALSAGKKNPKSCFGNKSLEVTEEMRVKTRKNEFIRNTDFHTRSRNRVAPEKLNAIRKVESNEFRPDKKTSTFFIIIEESNTLK